jgi:hypothetical protein
MRKIALLLEHTSTLNNSKLSLEQKPNSEILGYSYSTLLVHQGSFGQSGGCDFCCISPPVSGKSKAIVMDSGASDAERGEGIGDQYVLVLKLSK